MFGSAEICLEMFTAFVP